MPVSIDFITVTHRPDVARQLAESIELLMHGLGPARLTTIDGTTHDLFTGYNAGAAQTMSDLLAFVHDDVRFLGNRLTLERPIGLLSRPDVGFVGVAGSGVLSKDATWWGFRGPKGNLPACRGMITHPAPETDFGCHVDVWPHGPAAAFGRVLVLDGVLLMCHRRTFDRLGGFDAASYRGFHFYDIDITFRASLERLSNLAAPIPLLHQSGGKLTAEWEASRAVFLKKFGHLLPLGIR